MSLVEHQHIDWCITKRHEDEDTEEKDVNAEDIDDHLHEGAAKAVTEGMGEDAEDEEVRATSDQNR
ncbi:hypothetical protein BGX38DRAFT_1265230 [Terfezia claveryi]|nr:hypothetical protein BGX38DRAFT_1265230 [Terfezia claveryi]